MQMIEGSFTKRVTTTGILRRPGIRLLLLSLPMMVGKTIWTCAPIHCPLCRSLDCLKWAGKSAPQQIPTLVKIGAHTSLKEGLDPLTNLMGKVNSDIWMSMVDQIIAQDCKQASVKPRAFARHEGDPGSRRHESMLNPLRMLLFFQSRLALTSSNLIGRCRLQSLREGCLLHHQ
jgi:hypothetical protein